MRFRVSLLIWLAFFAFVAVPLAVNVAFGQTTQTTVDYVSYDAEPAADGGEATPQGIPIDCPGGPT
ncbi:MAG: hypothetical protein QXX51_08860 [Candidatus Bathyarchaeia archaeon]